MATLLETCPAIACNAHEAAAPAVRSYIDKAYGRLVKADIINLA
jgi:hypothetical protein